MTHLINTHSTNGIDFAFFFSFSFFSSSMSKKYYDKILSGSGTSSVQVKSAFGSKILAKYGWTEGQGLGASMSGVKECVQIEKREERIGIGCEKNNESSEWDNWWSGAYDSVAAKISVKVNKSEKKKKRKVVESSSDSETSAPSTPVSQRRRVKRHVRDE